MQRATINLAPLLDVLFIILFVIMGQRTEEAKMQMDIEHSQQKKLTREKQTLQQQYGSIEKSLQQEFDARQSLQRELLQKQRERQELEERLQQEKQAVENLNFELQDKEKLQERYRDLEEKYQQLQDRGRELEEKYRQLQTQLSTLTKQHEQDTSLFKKSIEELKKQKEALLKKLQDVNEMLQQVNNEKEEISEEKLRLAEQIKDLEATITQCETQLEKKQEALLKLKKGQRELEERQRKLEEKVKKLNKKLIDSYLQEKIEKKRFERLNKQYQRMDKALKGRELHRTITQAQILSDNFSIYEIVLLLQQRVDEDTYVGKMTIKKPDGKKVEGPIQEQEDVRALLRQAIPPAVRNDASHTIFMIFTEGKTVIAHMRWVEEELQAIQAIYGFHEIP